MQGCIEAMGGSQTKKGYIQVAPEEWTRNRHSDLAHRKAWRRHFGPIPSGLHVCHMCDNPPCINPEHLFLGTIEDNNKDKARKGRAPGNRKIDEVIATGIMARCLQGVSRAQVAREFGTSYDIVQHIWLGLSWQRLFAAERRR